MGTILTCPLGHTWEAPRGGSTTDAFFLCPVCGAVEASRADPDATQAESDLPAITATPTGVPGYEIMGELGRGGMGVVYKARHIKLKRLVALKMILTGAHAGPKELARFHAEAEAVARLHHPNIVQIYEVGEQDGLPYLSLEYVGGGSLGQQLDGTPFPPLQAAGLIETLARAMDYAHRQGVVHRDLKPANVLLAGAEEQRAEASAETGIRGQLAGVGPRLAVAAPVRGPEAWVLTSVPKITDFGLAKRLDSKMGQTQSGAVLGTAAYMAPEQAGGKTRDVGPTVDVWALGAMLYELLTGQAPFRGETPLDTMLQVMSNEPAPLSRAEPRVPRDLETICLKCLEKDPRRRYASAFELADDLERFRTEQPISARRLSFAGRAVKWARRRRELAAVGAVAVIALAVAGFVLWQRPVAETPQQRAVRLAPRAQEILHRYCYDCHGRDQRKVEKDLNVLDYSAMLGSERKMIVPFKPDESKLIERIDDESMPPLDKEDHPRLSQDEITELKQWIAGGAPPFPQRQMPEPQAPTPEQTALASEAKAVFKEYCYRCHKAGKMDGGIKIYSYELLVDRRKVVIPGDAEQSKLYRMLLSEEEDRMPPEGYSRPRKAEIETIKRWIEAGAPPWPKKR